VDSFAASVTGDGAGSGGGGGAPPTGCRVSYRPNSWPGGFTADVAVTNTGATPIDGWSLAFALPAGQTVSNAWNAAITPTSGTVAARNLSYNASIPPGGSQSFGFQGSYSGTFARPAAFSLNGTSCAVS
jgi:cellulase/cellobiase CelA1